MACGKHTIILQNRHDPDIILARRVRCGRWDCPFCGPLKGKKCADAIFYTAIEQKLANFLTVTIKKDEKIDIKDQTKAILKGYTNMIKNINKIKIDPAKKVKDYMKKTKKGLKLEDIERKKEMWRKLQEEQEKECVEYEIETEIEKIASTKALYVVSNKYSIFYKHLSEKRKKNFKEEHKREIQEATNMIVEKFYRDGEISVKKGRKDIKITYQALWKKYAQLIHEFFEKDIEYIKVLEIQSLPHLHIITNVYIPLMLLDEELKKIGLGYVRKQETINDCVWGVTGRQEVVNTDNEDVQRLVSYITKKVKKLSDYLTKKTGKTNKKKNENEYPEGIRIVTTSRGIKLFEKNRDWEKVGFIKKSLRVEKLITNLDDYERDLYGFTQKRDPKGEKRKIEEDEEYVIKKINKIAANVGPESPMFPVSDILSKDQRNAVYNVLTNPVIIITGPAGSGKTTVIKELKRVLPGKVKIVSPTGRAAVNSGGMTGHRYLGADMEQRVELHQENVDNTITTMIIDEASAMPFSIFTSLLKAVNQFCRIVIIGDNNQLPPVSGRSALDVLEGMKLKGEIRVKEIKLKENHRNSNTILANSQKILKGDPKWVQDESFRVKHKISLKEVKELISRGYQVLCYRNATCNMVNKLSSKKEFYSIFGYGFHKGDKVMQTKNSLGKSIMNGEIGIVIDAQKNSLKVEYNGKQIEYTRRAAKDLKLAYASTVHKFQGSEAEKVVLILDDKRHMTKNWLYTAVTRAKKKIIIARSLV